MTCRTRHLKEWECGNQYWLLISGKSSPILLDMTAQANRRRLQFGIPGGRQGGPQTDQQSGPRGRGCRQDDQVGCSQDRLPHDPLKGPPDCIHRPCTRGPNRCRNILSVSWWCGPKGPSVPMPTPTGTLLRSRAISLLVPRLRCLPQWSWPLRRAMQSCRIVASPHASASSTRTAIIVTSRAT